MAGQETIDRLTGFYQEADQALTSGTPVWAPPARQSTPRVSWKVQLLAATGVLLFGVTAGVLLHYGRLNSTVRPAVSPSPTASARPSTSPTLRPAAPLPAHDLVIAHLTHVPALISRFDVTAVDQGRTVTLLGAYADPARTVLIFRIDPGVRIADMVVNDGHSWLNGSTSGGSLRDSDYVIALDEGAKAGSDGLVRLILQISSLESSSGTNSAPTRIAGSWRLSATLPLQPSVSLPAPSQFKVGSWTGDLEVLELTPSVIHLQAVLHGPSIPDLGFSTVALVDPAGKVTPLGCGGSITVDKMQLNPTNYKNTRIYCYAERPAAGGTYQIRFQGGGGRYNIPLNLPPV